MTPASDPKQCFCFLIYISIYNQIDRNRAFGKKPGRRKPTIHYPLVQSVYISSCLRPNPATVPIWSEKKLKGSLGVDRFMVRFVAFFLGSSWDRWGIILVTLGLILVTLGLILVTWGGPGHPLRARSRNFTEGTQRTVPGGSDLGVILESFW